MNTALYVCPECGFTVSFYEGFSMDCVGTDESPKHTFKGRA